VKEGSLGALYAEFVLVLLAFFCKSEILLIFVCEMMLIMLVQFNRCE
jgi:hypothetical protein